MIRAKVTTFKASGKFYSEETHDFHVRYAFDLPIAMRALMNTGNIPGLREGAKEFHCVVQEEGSDVPHLLINKDIL